MRSGGGANPRQQWYDRNPLAVPKIFVGTLTPLGLTNQWTYTVPVGRKAYIEMLYAELVRITVAAPVGNASARLSYTPSGGAAGELMGLDLLNNTVGASAVVSLGASMLIFAGDTLVGQTSDSSTGGSILYRINAKATEFDA